MKVYRVVKIKIRCKSEPQRLRLGSPDVYELSSKGSKPSGEVCVTPSTGWNAGIGRIEALPYFREARHKSLSASGRWSRPFNVAPCSERVVQMDERGSLAGCGDWAREMLRKRWQRETDRKRQTDLWRLEEGKRMKESSRDREGEIKRERVREREWGRESKRTRESRR